MNAHLCQRCVLYTFLAVNLVGVDATRKDCIGTLEIDEGGHLHNLTHQALTVAEQHQDEERMSGVRKQLLECIEPLGPADAILNLHLPQIKLIIQRGIGLDLYMRRCTTGEHHMDAREHPAVQRVVARQADYLLQFGVARLCRRIDSGSTWMGMGCGTTPYAEGRPIRTPSDAVNSLRIWASMLSCKMTERFDELHDWGKEGMIRKAAKIAATHAVTAVTSLLFAGGFELAAHLVTWGSNVMSIAEAYQHGAAETRKEAVNFIVSVALQAAALAVHGHIPLEHMFAEGIKFATLEAITLEMTEIAMKEDLKLLVEAQVQCEAHHDLEHEAEVLQAIAKGTQPLYSGKCKENLMAPYPGNSSDFTMRFGCVCSTNPPLSNSFCPDTDEATCTSINGHNDDQQMKANCNEHTILGFMKTHKYCAWKPVFTESEDTCVSPSGQPHRLVTEASIDLADAMAACVCTQSGGDDQRYCESFEVGDTWMDQLTLRSRIVYAQETGDAQEVSRLTNICKQATMKTWFFCFPGKDYLSCQWKTTSVKLTGGDCYET